MEILDLNLKGYGKFSNHKIAFTPGINVITGGNETGKTTIHSFICAMLFGLNRGRGRAASQDEYQLRRPWDSPGNFLGSMRFSQDGKVYRIDRCFDHNGKPLSLVNETDAQEFSDPQGKLDELLGGLSETAFVNSVYIPQMQIPPGEALAEELRRFMINTSTSMDEGVDVSAALSDLRRKKKDREQELKKDDAALQEEIARKQGEADTLRGEIELLRSQNTQGKKELTTIGSADWYGGEPDEEKPVRGNTSKGLSDGMRRLLIGMLALAALLCAAGIFLAESMMFGIFFGILAVLFGTLAFAVHTLFSPDYEEEEEEESEDEEKQDLKSELADKEAAYKNKQEDLEVLYQRHAETEQDTETEALNLAIERICDISSGIFKTNGGALNETASRILEEITQGKYNRITIDDTAQVRIHTPDRVLGIREVSGGTMQQIYFAVRIAAGDLFCGENRFPVILDETFAMYDDERLRSTLAWLKKSGRQVILFSCQIREREILKQL